MPTDSDPQPKKRGRWNKIFSQSIKPQSTFPGPAIPIHLKSKSSETPGEQDLSSCRNENADLGALSTSLVDSTAAAAPTPSAKTLDQDLLDRALKLLEDQERSTISAYLLLSTDDIGSALEKALTAAKEKQKVCGGQNWTLTIGNRSFKLQDKADKVILWLDKFKGAMDIASNADPIHVGIPWAGIRLLLEVYMAITCPVNYLIIFLTII